MGGDLVRLYVDRFPKQVAGVVLIEPSNEERWSLIAGLHAQWEGFRSGCRNDKWKAHFGLMRLSSQPLEEYPRSVRALAEALSYAPKAEAANCGEINSIIGDGPQQIARSRTIWNIPLIVITAGQNIFAEDTSLPDRDRAGGLWREMQADTAHISSRGEQVLAVRSGHFVQFDEPNLVVVQVRGLLNELSSSTKIKQSKRESAAPSSHPTPAFDGLSQLIVYHFMFDSENLMRKSFVFKLHGEWSGFAFKYDHSDTRNTLMSPTHAA
jgi:pimeloyl-ACP methyl ester carboxylesterase